MTRDEAVRLLAAAEPDDYLKKHSLYSEAIMRALAKHFGEDEDLWGLTGLLHDIDFPQTKHGDPAQHGTLAANMLPGAPEAMTTAIAAHNGEHTGVPPTSKLDFALRCGETVTGMISAAALVRPEGFEGMQPKSIKKKMKDKAFAAAVNRETIKECEKIGLELDAFLALSIAAMADAPQEL